jgi:hypothetical protein
MLSIDHLMVWLDVAALLDDGKGVDLAAVGHVAGPGRQDAVFASRSVLIGGDLCRKFSLDRKLTLPNAAIYDVVAI